MNIVLLVLLLLLLFGGLPYWGYHSLGWGISGPIGILIVILIVLALTGRL